MFRPGYNSNPFWCYNRTNDGVYNSSGPASEAVSTRISHSAIGAFLPMPQNLDMQYTVGLATGILIPVNLISVGNNSVSDGAHGYLNTAEYVMSDQTDAYVMTTSYGSNESDVSIGVNEQV